MSFQNRSRGILVLPLWSFKVSPLLAVTYLVVDWWRLHGSFHSDDHVIPHNNMFCFLDRAWAFILGLMLLPSWRARFLLIVLKYFSGRENGVLAFSVSVSPWGSVPRWVYFLGHSHKFVVFSANLIISFFCCVLSIIHCVFHFSLWGHHFHFVTSVMVVQFDF